MMWRRDIRAVGGETQEMHRSAMKLSPHCMRFWPDYERVHRSASVCPTKRPGGPEGRPAGRARLAVGYNLPMMGPLPPRHSPAVKARFDEAFPSRGQSPKQFPKRSANTNMNIIVRGLGQTSQGKSYRRFNPEYLSFSTWRALTWRLMCTYRCFRYMHFDCAVTHPF